MIKPRHSAPVLHFFRWYIPFILRRDFDKVEIHGKAGVFPHAILALSNHFSWWDAFILFYLNKKVFKKKYHVMMLEEQLRRYWFFNYGGVYSVRKKSRSIIDSLNFTVKLLEGKGNLVQLFPQGKIQSQHITGHRFEKGLSYILKRMEKPFHLVFTVALVDYYSKRYPAMHIFYEEHVLQDHSNLLQLEGEYNDFFARCKLWMINSQHE